MHFLCAIRDLIFKILPNSLVRLFVGKTSFCFLVHPRDIKDVRDYFPLWKFLPEKSIKWLLRKLWPLIGPKITGLQTHDGQKLNGRIIFCPLLPEQLILRRKNKVTKKLIKAAQLADTLSAKVIGLGGFNAAASRYGQDLIGRIKANITTGHTYTTYAVVEIARMAANIVGLEFENAIIAVIGAAGSMGSACAELIDHTERVKELLLVEIPARLDTLKKMSQKTNNQVSFTADLSEIRRADLIITLTNAVDSIIEADYLKPGVIVVDDSQPVNVSRDIININSDVLIVGCAIQAQNINCHYDFGLPREAIFTCLGEVLAMCAYDCNSKFLTTGRVNIDQAKDIARMVESLGFYPLLIDNQGRSITYQKLWKVCEVYNGNAKKHLMNFDSHPS